MTWAERTSRVDGYSSPAIIAKDRAVLRGPGAQSAPRGCPTDASEGLAHEPRFDFVRVARDQHLMAVRASRDGTPRFPLASVAIVAREACEFAIDHVDLVTSWD